MGLIFSRNHPKSYLEQGESSKNHLQKNRTRFSVDWVIPERIAIGPLPQDHHHVERLQQSQIQSILSLCSEKEGTPPPSLLANLHWQRFPLPDSHWNEPLTEEALGQAVEKLQNLQSHIPPVYIHCVAGMERSPTVCIAYLCCYNGLKVLEGLRYLKQVHPATAPTPNQLNVIQAFVKSKV